jgi:hypothetical protein
VSEIEDTYDDIRANGTASVMIVRCEEMPALYLHAEQGDHDAQMRLSAVARVLPAITSGKHTCVCCSEPVTLNRLRAVVFVAKQIEQGADALWTLVCNECDPDNPQDLVKIILDKLGFKRITHEAGHA